MEYDIGDFINDTVSIKLPHNNEWYGIEILTQNTLGYQVSYYGNAIDVQTVYGDTYVGAGNIVGTTKNVIWLNKLNNDIVEDKYIQTVLYSHEDTNDFNPFNEKIIKSKE